MHVHEVLIIGAGPCGLAAAARLCERTPSATFTDDEHQRYHWIRKHGRKMTIKNYKTNKDSFSATCEDFKRSSPDIIVLDAEAKKWMGRWSRLFKTFDIDFLRSPMFFHIDPSDRDALLGYTFDAGRQKELFALSGCVGKEVSKHRKKRRQPSRHVSQSGPDVDERDRHDYFTPSAGLFAAHCCEVAAKYGLHDDMIKQEKALDISYCTWEYILGRDNGILLKDISDTEQKVFRITTDKETRYAHSVILAVGPGNTPTIPRIPGFQATCPDAHEGFAHAMQLRTFPPRHMVSRIQQHRDTNLLIVGGGLTSIQLADIAIKKGVRKVWLLMRGPLKIKYFDLDLDWVGKFRNFNQASFWSADTDLERLEMLQNARNGGSITPRYRKILDKHIADGRISLHTYEQLTGGNWDEQTMKWSSLHTKTGQSLPPMDFVVFATGVQTDVSTIPFLKSMHEHYPIDIIGGLPCLNDDLMWCDDVPLFVTGRLAGLRLGPGAPNLIGARVGAERLAWSMEDVLDKVKNGNNYEDDIAVEEDVGQKLVDAATGVRNRFDSLGEDLA